MAEEKEVVIPTNFTSAVSLTEIGLSHVPKRFILPVSQRPNLDVKHSPNTSLPLVDLALLHHNTLRSHVIGEIGLACKEFGFFQVIINFLLLVTSSNYSSFNYRDDTLFIG